MAIESIVLLLQGETAYWFRMANSCVVDTHAQALKNEQLVAELSPPWMSIRDESAGPGIELVLDTSLDEVDRVVIEPSEYSWLNRYRLWVTLRQLRHDYTNAKSYSISTGSGEVIAGLMHFIIPESWLDYLACLQESGYIFTNASTATEILALWSRRFDSPVLIVFRGETLDRYVLVNQGKVILLRSVSSTETVSIQSEINETRRSLEHIKDHIALSVETLPVVSFTDAAFVPLSLLLGTQLSARITQWSINELKPVAPTKEYCSKAVAKSKNAFFSGNWKRLLSGDRNFLVPDSAANNDILLHPVLRFMPVFQPSIAQQTRRRRLKWASRLTPLCLFLLLIVLLVTLRNHVSTTHLANSQWLERKELQLVLSKSRELASSLHKTPAIAADSLRIGRYLPAADAMQSIELLETIGTVMTSAPGMELDSLTWANVHKDEDYNSLGNILDDVAGRKQILRPDDRYVLQAELAGRVSAESLQDKMHKLDRFTQLLSQMPGALSVSVHQSPADLALSSDVGLSSVAHFSISFRMEAIW